MVQTKTIDVNYQDVIFTLCGEYEPAYAGTFDEPGMAADFSAYEIYIGETDVTGIIEESLYKVELKSGPAYFSLKSYLEELATEQIENE